MDSEQIERIKNFEERQKRKEKRNKFGKVVFGEPDDGFYSCFGILALPLYLIRVVVGLGVWLIGIVFFSTLIKKAFKKPDKLFLQ